MTAKNLVCLWYEGGAEEAANFYAATFPDTRVTGVHKAPSDYPDGKAGDVLTVDFTVMGIPCIGLNGGSTFKQSEAFSFQVATDSQEETDRYWNAIVGNGGQESQCGWCKDESMPMGEMGNYDFIDHGGEMIGAVMRKPNEMPMGAWNYYIHVDDIDTSTAAVKSGGGQVLMGPMEVPGGDWVINGIDPQGAPFSLVGSKKG